MSSGLPTASIVGTTGALATTTGAPPITSGPAASVNLAPLLDPAAVLSPAELTTAVRGLTLAVSNLRMFLQGPYAPFAPIPGTAVPPSPPPAAPPAPSPSIAASHQGVPITQIRFLPSPSQLRPGSTHPSSHRRPPSQPCSSRPRHPWPPIVGGFAGYGDPYAGGSWC
jgi:hypothetical protein